MEFTCKSSLGIAAESSHKNRWIIYRIWCRKRTQARNIYRERCTRKGQRRARARERERNAERQNEREQRDVYRLTRRRSSKLWLALCTLEAASCCRLPVPHHCCCYTPGNDERIRRPEREREEGDPRNRTCEQPRARAYTYRKARGERAIRG